MNAEPSWIGEFAEAIEVNFKNHDVKVHMPFNGWNYYPIFADLWVDKIYKAVQAFETKDLK
jgi:hypothetical protein